MPSNGIRTHAEIVAEYLEEDCYNYHSEEGWSLDQLCRASNARKFGNTGLRGHHRYLFTDGSAIIDTGKRWGIEHPDNPWILTDDEPNE